MEEVGENDLVRVNDPSVGEQRVPAAQLHEPEVDRFRRGCPGSISPSCEVGAVLGEREMGPAAQPAASVLCCAVEPVGFETADRVHRDER